MSNNLYTASEQWRDRPADQRFESLIQLSEAVSKRRTLSRSAEVDLSKVRVSVTKENDSDIIEINGATEPSRPSNWSFGQLSQWVKAPASYLRTLPAPVVADCLRHGLSKQGSETLKFMTFSGDNHSTLQAVTSTTYGRIWDADVVLAAQRIVDSTGGKFYNPKAYVNGQQRPSGLYASDRDCFIFMIDGGSYLEAGPRAKINRGFFMWNSEVGRSSFGLTTFLHNGVCGNHIVWGVSDVTELIIRHTSGGPARFDSQAVPILLDYANASMKPIETVIKRAQEKIIWDGKEESFKGLLEFANKHSQFTKGELTNAIARAREEEGDCRTLWQVVQGLTAYARGFEWVDSRTDLETRAGKLLELVNIN